MDKTRKLIEKILQKNYITDPDLQRKIIRKFVEIHGITEEDEEEVIISRVSGFIYTCMKNNLCTQDELAWGIFTSVFGGIFHRKLIEMDIKSEEERKELIQEFYRHIMNKCRDGKFNPEQEAKNAFMGYIVTAFIRFTINQLRKKNVGRIKSLDELAEIHPSLLISHPGFSGCQKLIHIMELNGFPLEDRMIIQLKCDGYRQKEISRVLGKSEAYVSRRFRAISEKLRKIINDPDELLYG